MSNVYLNASLVPSAEINSTLYSCPEFKTAVLKSILVCNPSGGALSVTIKLGDNFLFNAKPVASNETIELLTAPLVVESTGVVSVEGSGSIGLNILASVLEIG